MRRLAVLLWLLTGAAAVLTLLSLLAISTTNMGWPGHATVSVLVTGVAGALLAIAAYAVNKQSVESERARHELQQRERELNILYQVLRQVSAMMDPGGIRDLILRMLIEALGAKSCHMLLLEPHLTEAVLCSMSRGDEHVTVRRDELTNLLGPDVDPFTVPPESPELVNAATFLQHSENHTICWVPINIQEQRIGIVLLLREGEALSKDEMELFRTLSGGLAMAVENARLYELAITDSITGLYVRRYFDERLHQESSRAARYNTELSVLVLDLDRFKEINDTYGHTVGDEVLHAVAQAILRGTRDSDIAARWGGDEFAVLLPETGADAAERTADRIREAVAATRLPIDALGCTTMTVSIGVASYPLEVTDVEELVKLADKALYEAKRRGRNRVVRAADSLQSVDEAQSEQVPPGQTS